MTFIRMKLVDGQKVPLTQDENDICEAEEVRWREEELPKIFIQRMNDALRSILHTQSVALGFSNEADCLSYMHSSLPEFKNKAIAFCSWRDECYTALKLHHDELFSNNPRNAATLLKTLLPVMENN